MGALRARRRTGLAELLHEARLRPSEETFDKVEGIPPLDHLDFLRSDAEPVQLLEDHRPARLNIRRRLDASCAIESDVCDVHEGPRSGSRD